ncbi:ADGRL2 [Branchiostoma lanceolatum]|uniref:ADGRL2 protein n=1 Tax=Branchiostoma lanceolatum TaxID=7740 RepID=A0A8K0EIF0_BRALA|nr:ADGRL2 [Branchiostoma lanceolatum]
MTTSTIMATAASTPAVSTNISFVSTIGTFILDTTTTTAMAPTTTGITSSTMAITTTVAKTTSMTSPGNGPIITPTETSSACEGKTLRLSCSAGETLEIDGANFGRTSKSHRCNCGLFCNTINTCYAANSLSIVKSACQGKRECAVEATKSVFGDPCPFIGKYLEATYRCVPEANIERGDPEEP